MRTTVSVYEDQHTGKVYRVAGTTVAQYDGKHFFSGTVLHSWGKRQSVTDFKTPDALESWLKMMGFRG